MRVIFMGTPDFSVGILEALVEASHEIVLVVTQPDKPKGRGKSVQYTPVKEAALAHNIEVFQPQKIREESCVDYLKGYKADIIVVVAFGQILPKSILEMAPHGCVNVHASLLPKYRGAAPIQWAIIDGEKVTGVTTMKMDAGIDTGDMMGKKTVIIDAKETGGSLFTKLSVAGASLCVETLKDMEEQRAVFEKQDDNQSTYAKMIQKELGSIQWNQEAVVIERLIRGLNPWPSAYTKFDGKIMKIWDAEVLKENRAGVCGEVVEVTSKHIIVKTKDGLLALNEIQLEGKKRMSVEAFLRGVSIKQGMILN